MKLRRFLSLLVALVMTVEVLPLSSFAAEIEDATENVEVSAEGILEETETMEVLYGEVTEEESEPILGATAEEAESSDEADIATVSNEETDNGDVAVVSESTESNAIISYSGTCGDNLTWALYSDGLLVILGTGEMTDYVDSPTAFDTRAPWFSYRSSIESVIVDSGVTSIGNYAFRGCTNMTSIVLPDTVESIGEYAFYESESLAEVSISGCVIGTYAFCSCTSLSSINFSGEITSIGYRAFYNTACYNDTDTWYDGVLYIGNWLIATDNSFETCSILGGTVGIADRAFYENTGLTTVYMPSSLKYIGTSAFYKCTALSNVTFGNNIKTIGSYAFYNCSSLKNLSLSTESVTSIGTYAFYGTGYYKDSNNWTGDLLYVDTWLVNIRGSRLLSSTDITVKYGTTGIADYTFREQSTLTSISIPNGVKYIGEGAFYKCSSITGISVPDSVVTDIGDYLFYQCSSLEYVDGYSSATSIGDYAFYRDSSLTGFSIPAGVTSIGVSAFNNCTSLDGVDLSNVTSIGSYAFYTCESLKSVQIICDVGESTFQYCTSLEDVTFGDSVTSIGKSAFNGCSSLTTVVLPESVVSIDQYAFTDCYLDAVWILAIAMEGIGYVTSTSKVFDETDEFVIYGYSGSFAESYADAHSITFIAIDYFTKTLSVTVCDPDGTVLTDGYTVAWYDSDGNVVGTDSVLRINSYDTCTVVVTLDDELTSLYEQPDEYTFTSSESEEYTITLEEIPTTLLTGTVTDGNGMPLSGATISVLTQSGNTYTVLTDEAGTFNVYVSKEEISVKIQMNGYYSHTAYIDLSDFAQSVYDFGTYALTGVISDGIILSITKYDAAVDVSDRIATTVIYADTLDISLTDSYGNAITGFEVQGTNIVFEPGVVSPGETICVSVADPTGKYVSTGSVTTTLDGNSRGEVSLSLIQKGGFMTGNLTGEDATVTVLDSNENVVLSSSTSSNTTYCELDSGKYTVILIEKTSLFRTALSEDYLSQLGLTEGVDYLAFDISVEDGVIIVLDDCNIPEIDDDKLSYVVANKTSLTVSKSSGITIGEMFTICAKYEIDSSKNVQSDSVSIVFPEGINPSTLNSVLVDNVVSSYSYNSKTRTLTVDTLGKDSASIYLMGQAGSESGNYYLCAYLNMSDGAMQSIGSAKVTVELSSFDVAERTSSSTVIASGITAPYSELTIYDNGVAVTTTTSNAVGK
ncbi:MAG: leucine-rich repeat protein [Oscillospiraceae bacterium]|nr:leucine-rich repeat protein [Oscillospiraceae bacterium]